MDILRETRLSDSPLVHSISRSIYVKDSQDVTRPDGSWDLVFIKHHDQTKVLLTGLITHPVALANEEGDEILSVSFKPGVFIPHIPGQQMVNAGVLLPKARNESFWLGSDVLEIPRFENVDSFIARMAKESLLACDEIVTSVLEGEANQFSERSIQRHFIQRTGMTFKRLQQIQRAQTAVALLQQGKPATEVAYEVGYADQPHMTKSLKQIMGQTPRQIVKASQS
jgi:hypothetical protein